MSPLMLFGDIGTDTGLCFLSDTGRVSIVMRGVKVGEFEWSPEMVEPMRALARVLAGCADTLQGEL